MDSDQNSAGDAPENTFSAPEGAPMGDQGAEQNAGASEGQGGGDGQDWSAGQSDDQNAGADGDAGQSNGDGQNGGDDQSNGAEQGDNANQNGDMGQNWGMNQNGDMNGMGNMNGMNGNMGMNNDMGQNMNGMNGMNNGNMNGMQNMNMMNGGMNGGMGNMNGGMNGMGNMGNMNGMNGMNGNMGMNMGMNQNMQQPKPPRKPMDPATKKKVIIASCCAGGVALLGILAAIILPIILHVDYGETYRTAGELRTAVNEVYYSSACQHVEDYAGSGYVSNKDYNTYIQDCKSVGTEAVELSNKLAETPGVTRNSEIKAKYEAFRAEFDSMLKNSDQKDSILDTYKIWHEWTVASKDLSSWDETDADLTAAANVLIQSGNEKFSTYGQGWLTRRKTAAAAYRAYWNSSYSDSNRTALRVALQDAQDDYENFVSENKPSVADFGDLVGSNAKAMKDSFESLYTLITDTYEKNYNWGSGDCTELRSVVTCG